MMELLQHCPFIRQLVLALQLQGGTVLAGSVLWARSALLCLEIIAAMLGMQL